MHKPPEERRDGKRNAKRWSSSVTGVREKTVITNRHVVEALDDARTTFGLNDEQLWLTFVFRTDRGLANGFAKIGDFSCSNNPNLDLAFIEFALKPPEFEVVQPLDIGDLTNLRVGQPVAVCGYPYGTQMLKRGNRIYRFGPVLQQGYISAISPFDGSSEMDEILLDVRTAGGMSGSPVFLPEDGTVVGVHYAGWEATTALAIPLHAGKIDPWLREHENAKAARRR